MAKSKQKSYAHTYMVLCCALSDFACDGTGTRGTQIPGSRIAGGVAGRRQ